MCTVWYSKWLSNESASDFALGLNIAPWKLFGWFRRPELWATGNWQFHQENVSTHASHLMESFFGEISNPPGDSAFLEPRFGILWVLAFPKTKITFKRKEISDHWWQSGKYNGAADGSWENCRRSQVPPWKGTEASLSPSLFLVSRIFFSKCLYFSNYMAG